MIGIKVHSSLPLRKGTRDCVVSTQSVCAAGTSEPVLILKVLMCTRRRSLKSTLQPTIFWEMVKFVDLGVLYFSLVLPV